jgi:hypothetical protein
MALPFNKKAGKTRQSMVPVVFQSSPAVTD